jgi:hypothetical protein
MDGDIPVSAVLISASPHDSHVAIPLAQMTSERLTNLYDLMDSAYDAPEIREFSIKITKMVMKTVFMTKKSTLTEISQILLQLAHRDEYNGKTFK